MVAILINEKGDVGGEKVVQASSPQAVEFLLSQARSLKFKPRPGCGAARTTVNFTLQGG